MPGRKKSRAVMAAIARKAEARAPKEVGRNKHHPHANAHKEVDRSEKAPIQTKTDKNSHEKNAAHQAHEAGKHGGKHTSSAAPAKSPAASAKAAPAANKSPAAGAKSPEKKAASPKTAPKSPQKGPVADSIFPPDENPVGKDQFKTYDTDSVIGMTAPSLASLDWVPNKDYARPTAGKPYVALIWAQYHKPGYKFVALYSKLAEKYRGKVDVVAISIDPNKADGPAKFVEDPAKKYSKGEFPLEYAVAHDAGGKHKKAYMDGLRGVLTPPHAFLIDKHGKVVWHQDHSELGATVPTYMQLFDKQVHAFLHSGKVAKVGDRVVVEAPEEEEEEDEEQGVVADDLDLF